MIVKTVCTLLGMELLCHEHPSTYPSISPALRQLLPIGLWVWSDMLCLLADVCVVVFISLILCLLVVGFGGGRMA